MRRAPALLQRLLKLQQQHRQWDLACQLAWCQPQQQRRQRRQLTTHAGLHHHAPRRALLYVPGSAEKKIRKAAREIGADSIVMDCEDGVAHSMKDAARTTIALMLDDLEFGASEAAVRVNPVGSGLAEEDLRAALSAKRLPDALVVPKVESADEVRWVMDRVQQLLAGQRQRPRVQDTGSGREGPASGGGGSSVGSTLTPYHHKQQQQRPLAFIPMCESAMSLLNLRQTFECAAGHAAAGVLQLQACIFGGDDFAASLGATRTPGNEELAHARGTFLLVCRALQVQAIDIVKIDLSEAGMQALQEESKAAALAGFSGKQVIHPKQVPVVQAAFSPSAAELDAALRLVAAYQEHQARGHGAFVFEGKMIDAPSVLQARNVLALAERLEQLA